VEEDAVVTHVQPQFSQSPARSGSHRVSHLSATNRVEASLPPARRRG
jgi:hypothetical protein